MAIRFPSPYRPTDGQHKRPGANRCCVVRCGYVSMIQTHLFVSENGVYPSNGQFCREQ